MGCGYETFTIPAARMNQGMVYALEVDDQMIVATQKKARKSGVKIVHAVQHPARLRTIEKPDRSQSCLATW